MVSNITKLIAGILLLSLALACSNGIKNNKDVKKKKLIPVNIINTMLIE